MWHRREAAYQESPGYSFGLLGSCPKRTIVMYFIGIEGSLIVIIINHKKAILTDAPTEKCKYSVALFFFSDFFAIVSKGDLEIMIVPKLVPYNENRQKRQNFVFCNVNARTICIVFLCNIFCKRNL